VDGSVKSGALSPFFKVLDGGLDSRASIADPHKTAVSKSLLLILIVKDSKDYDINTETTQERGTAITGAELNASFAHRKRPFQPYRVSPKAVITEGEQHEL
jgi:hypothetical protein